jgi:coproporphyrinogen III oxidase-like Fe-S oxidoreductase
VDEYIVTREEYAGLGSGSFGYLGGRLYANTFSLPRYIERLERGAWPLYGSRGFSRRDRLRYDFLMKLFTGRLDLSLLEARHGARAERRLAPEIALFRALGALRREGRRLVLTEEGYYVWVVLMREFFSALNRLRAACRAAGK